MGDDDDILTPAEIADQKPDDTSLDASENPVGTMHLPVSGEVGVGQVPYHDPVTHDTDDTVPEDEPII